MDGEQEWAPTEEAPEAASQPPQAGPSHRPHATVARPSMWDYYGNAIFGGLAMIVGAYFALMAMAGLEASETFFDSTNALLTLIAGVAMGGLGFVGVVVNELIKEIRKMRLGLR